MTGGKYLIFRQEDSPPPGGGRTPLNSSKARITGPFCLSQNTQPHGTVREHHASTRGESVEFDQGPFTVTLAQSCALETTRRHLLGFVERHDVSPEVKTAAEMVANDIWYRAHNDPDPSFTTSFREHADALETAWHASRLGVD